MCSGLRLPRVLTVAKAQSRMLGLSDQEAAFCGTDISSGAEHDSGQVSSLVLMLFFGKLTGERHPSEIN